ncbi:hypothetical protein H1Z61_02040 [Bacillus aquiflavi]|uniref:Uncharacterized protein n=1 Tax=Bacillus aquiflavi TaxID=2672567 RepID=A0A6B3VXP6_9BACI|nr:hypothetical protein [Bacillus aquiflavi]MBA4535946.1 hypothetical protein [Bacillus aquiflavi]NEY80321.1 hypothetical protein [Bacillus aquiflavi]
MEQALSIYGLLISILIIGITIIILIVKQQVRKLQIYYQKTFSTLYSPLIIKAALIKKQYGCFEKQLYIINDHRTKQTKKMDDVLNLADDIFIQINTYKPLASKNALKHLFAIKEIKNEMAHIKQEQIYLRSLAKYEMNKEKLLLSKVFFKDMYKVAKKADFLYEDLETMLSFYPLFFDHLLKNELVKPRFARKKVRFFQLKG